MVVGCWLYDHREPLHCIGRKRLDCQGISSKHHKSFHRNAGNWAADGATYLFWSFILQPPFPLRQKQALARKVVFFFVRCKTRKYPFSNMIKDNMDQNVQMCLRIQQILTDNDSRDDWQEAFDLLSSVHSCFAKSCRLIVEL